MAVSDVSSGFLSFHQAAPEKELLMKTSIVVKNDLLVVIDLTKEFTDYNEKEQWAIITDLTDEELQEQFSELLNRFTPFVKMSTEQGEAIYEHNRVEDKCVKRAVNYEQPLPQTETDKDYEKISQDSFENNFIISEQIKEILSHLKSEIQRHRIIQHYLYGYSFVEIAAKEKVTKQAVRQSINEGIEFLKKFYN